MSNLIKTVTSTKTTSAGGNIQVVSIDSTLTTENSIILGAACTSRSDIECAVCTWSGSGKEWGIHCTGISNSYSAIANTSITIRLFYIKFA